MSHTPEIRRIVPSRQAAVLGKIALDVDRALALRAGSGAPGRTTPTPLARGAGWSVEDVICTSGPGDRSFEEQHRSVAIAVVVSGTFQYRASFGDELMTPGSLLLGNPGQYFECAHGHGAGDRCVAFRFSPELFEQLLAGVGRGARSFRSSRLPPLRASATLVARTVLGVSAPTAPAPGLAPAPGSQPWEEIAYRLVLLAVGVTAGGQRARGDAPAGAMARTTDSVRRIERDPAAPWTLSQLAAEARLSPFHYLRMFTRVTGVTPHQFILRARLRLAAMQLAANDAKIIEVASAAGFPDLSNFNHSFRAEFGVAPRNYRRIARR